MWFVEENTPSKIICICLHHVRAGWATAHLKHQCIPGGSYQNSSFEMLTLHLCYCCGTITLPLPLPADNRPTECVHTTKIPGRISRCVSQIWAKPVNLFLKYSYEKMSKRKNTVNCQYYLIFFFLHKLHSDGAHGCKSLPSDSDGTRPWTNVLSSLSNALWYQTSSFSWDYS